MHDPAVEGYAEEQQVASVAGQGWGNRWATASSNALVTSFNSSSKAKNSLKMAIFGNLYAMVNCQLSLKLTCTYCQFW